MNSPKLSSIRVRRGPTAAITPDPVAMQAEPRPLSLATFALASVSPLPLLFLGLTLGGPWLWAAFFYMTLFTLLLDQLIPLVPGTADLGEFPVADLLLVTIGLGSLALLPCATWAIAGASNLTLVERVIAFFACGFWLGQVGHPAAHELIHRPRRELFRLGAAFYIAVLFGQHASAHRLVHHRHVASIGDPNTARQGEGFYRFACRAWIGSFRLGLRAETDLRHRATRPTPNPYLFYVAGAVVALGAALIIAGPTGVVIWLALAGHVQSQILLSDYVQHYGLTRNHLSDGRLEPVGPAHSWNTAHWFTSAMMLNAPRHSDHHVHPSRAFPALRLPDDAPRLPWPLPVACALALSPRLWRRAITPHLTRWRESRPRDTAA